MDPGHEIAPRKQRTPERRAIQATSALAAALLLALLQGGCGATTEPPLSTAKQAPASQSTTVARQPSLPRGVVVQIGGTSITSAMLQHWITVEAAFGLEYQPGQPAPQVDVPDPPRYTRCIAHLASHAEPGRRLDRAQLKKECELERVSLGRSALQLLIPYYWAHQELHEKGMKLTGQELQQAEAEAPWRRIPRRILRAAGVRPADELFPTETRKLLFKLERATSRMWAEIKQGHPETPQMAEQLDAESRKLRAEIAARWTPRTHCASAYVVQGCEEYKPPAEP